MSEDPFSLDSLLEDLDAAVQSPAGSNQQQNGTMKFVPHPPARDKQTSHTTTFNPKNRFAVQPSSSSSHSSPEAPSNNSNNTFNSASGTNKYAYGSPEKMQPAYSSATVVPTTYNTNNGYNNTNSNYNTNNNNNNSHNTDENSIDNLLNLISSPPSTQKQTTTHTTTNTNTQSTHIYNSAFSYNNNNNNASNNVVSSQKVGSGVGHSGRFPTVTEHNTANNNTYNTNTTTNTTTHNNNNTYNANNANNTTYNTNTATSATNNTNYTPSITNNTTTYNTNNTSVYTAQVVAPDSNFSSPFDSPSSHGSAHKTYTTHNGSINTNNTHTFSPTTHSTHTNNSTTNNSNNTSTHHNNASTHSTSMYNMSTGSVFSTNNATSAFQPNLANSFDSAESGSDRVPALHTNNTYSSGSGNTTMYNNSSSNGGGGLQPIHTTNNDSVYNNTNKGRSGTGVSGGLFGSNTSNNTSTSGSNHTHYTNTSDTHNYNSYANAVSPKGNTATFTSQNGSLRTHSEPNNVQNDPLKASNSHFLPTSINATTVVSNSSSGSAVSSGKKEKCSRVVIGGVAIPRGRKTSAFAHFACNNLRCLQCNFKVHCFSGSEWDSSVDYMFLRNTVPNEAKLAAKLVRSGDKCAYCCQCSSASEGGERELNATLTAQGPQWVCAGH